jgi:integrase
MPRTSNGRSSIFQGVDGNWHGWVTVGGKSDGTPDRRHRKAKTKAEVTRRVRELEKRRETGQAVAARIPTLTTWMRQWLDTIAPRTAGAGTIQSTYRPKVEHWIVPRIGGHRLDKLRPGHLDALYLQLAAEGLSDKSVLMVHQIISRSLRMAMRRGLVARNVAGLVDAPRHRETEMSALTETEARAILAAAVGTPNGPRWSVALSLGLRQCEALGLRWQHLDLDRGEVKVFQLKRNLLQHGCADPHTCGARYHKANCAQACTNHAQWSPKRHGGDWTFTEPKGGKARVVAIPPQLIPQLRTHRATQAAASLNAGTAWHDWDLVFAAPTGAPSSPKDDWGAWKQLLVTAGVRNTRLHEARHTAATLLLEQGVDIRVVQQILGHSTLTVTKRYTHVTDKLAHDAADRIGRALWSS